MNEFEELRQNPLELICAVTGYLAAPTSAFFASYYLSNNVIFSTVASAATVVDMPANTLFDDGMPSIAKHLASGAYIVGYVLRGIVSRRFPSNRGPRQPLEQVLRLSKHWDERR